MKIARSAWLLAILMCGVAIAGIAGRPGLKAADKGKSMSLEQVVPREFGEWTELPDQSTLVVNPQTRQTLDRIYSQVLTRTYSHSSGYRVMLSIAYGDDQRGGLQAHRPEICYPAQGFQLGKVADVALATSFGSIDARRLSTSLGARNEPVTYWLTIGNEVIKSRFEKRMAEIRLGLTGQIPDGLIFRVSSIDVDDGRAFSMQNRFIADMVAAVPEKVRRQLSGLASTLPQPG